MPVIKAFVFDVYGTLFDVHSVIEKCEEYFPEKGESISKTWREKQIQYSNLRQIMNNYETFFTITKDALHYAIKAHDREFDDDSERALLGEYFKLAPYPEVKEVLEKLDGKMLAVFSNGSHDMLDPLIDQSELTGMFDNVISVDEVKQYKPAVASYNHAAKTLGVTPDEALFMSSNGWDISGAKNYGFNTAWINRNNLPVEELNLEPNAIYGDLAGILEWV
ncbi:haloacid dehalogenase type II [Virgibacillus kekensis]|uniref:Haloacid dehalogenase type II n=1 Tax=Virgibacillus kekensis TaxID=202261 RepID=A0ABV9DK77_9BACI